jgi:hypothetical protein
LRAAFGGRKIIVAITIDSIEKQGARIGFTEPRFAGRPLPPEALRHRNPSLESALAKRPTGPLGRVRPPEIDTKPKQTEQIAETENVAFPGEIPMDFPTELSSAAAQLLRECNTLQAEL